MRFSTLSRREKWPASVAELPGEPDQIAMEGGKHG